MKGAYNNSERLIVYFVQDFSHIIHPILCFNTGAVPGFVGDMGDITALIIQKIVKRVCVTLHATWIRPCFD